MTKLSDHIRVIINAWDNCRIEDTAKIVELRKDTSVYYYRLTELKSSEERSFIEAETKRKIQFNKEKKECIDSGMNATKSTSEAEVRISELRLKEIEHERMFKTYRDYISALEQILNAMSSSINQATNERKQGNYHT